MLSLSYSYSVLGLEGQKLQTYVARETILQVLLFSLIAQIWLLYWRWFVFVGTYQLAFGLGVLLAFTVLLIFINWIFQSDFDLAARQCGIVLDKDVESTSWSSVPGFLLFAVTLMIVWEMVVYLRFHHWASSPLGIMAAGYQLLTHSEIYVDILSSLSELLGGIALSGSISAIAYLSFGNSFMRNLVFRLLPLFYVLPLALWLLSWFVLPRWLPDFLNFWHKVIAVGFLVFFPFIQALWGLHDRAVIYRIPLAIDKALPVAFVAMLFAEAFASTSGLGFMMIAASATSQFDKALAGFLITALLLVALSTILRWIAKRFHSLKGSPIATVSAT